jgi:hypothetical protein
VSVGNDKSSYFGRPDIKARNSGFYACLIKKLINNFACAGFAGMDPQQPAAIYG